jgi:hypothetical protein
MTSNALFGTKIFHSNLASMAYKPNLQMLVKKKPQNNLNIHARYQNCNNIEGHNLGMKYCAIDTKYKILRS